MKQLWLIALLFIGGNVYAAKSQNVEIPRSVLKDNYRYYVLEEAKQATNFVLTYQRMGFDSMLFGKAEINCPSRAIRGLGQSIKSAKTIDTNNPSAWIKPPLGTIESDMVNYVCR